MKYAFLGNLVISGEGPAKLRLGRKSPAATSLVVSLLNLSAIIVILAVGNSVCSSEAVVTPTTPAPSTPTRNTPILSSVCVGQLKTCPVSDICICIELTT